MRLKSSMTFAARERGSSLGRMKRHICFVVNLNTIHQRANEYDIATTMTSTSTHVVHQNDSKKISCTTSGFFPSPKHTWRWHALEQFSRSKM